MEQKTWFDVVDVDGREILPYICETKGEAIDEIKRLKKMADFRDQEIFIQKRTIIYKE